MIVCNLTKPEATLDQVRKSFPKLQQTDAGQLAVALVLTGKYANAHYDDQMFVYPDDVLKLTKAISTELHQIAVSEPVKKTTKASATEEEPVEVKVGLTCNPAEAEKLLGDREDLKTLLSDIINEGIEFQYGPTDVLWQWALDRSNWSTVSEGELERRVRIKAAFQDNSVGTDLGATTGRKKSPRTTKAKVEKEEAAAVDTDEAVPG